MKRVKLDGQRRTYMTKTATTQKPPKVSRKLSLSKDKLTELTSDTKQPCLYTHKRSGCPIHTC
jgi:hypothetical protein